MTYTNIMELLMVNSVQRKRKIEEETKRFRNKNTNLIWVGGIFPLCWFSFNNSEMVKAVDLAFSSI